MPSNSGAILGLTLLAGLLTAVPVAVRAEDAPRRAAKCRPIC